MQKIEKLSAAGFAAFVRRGTVLVHFAMHGCAHCEKAASVIDKMAQQELFPESVRVARIYIDQSPLIAEKYDVEMIPALILFRDGVELQRHIGKVDEDTLHEMLMAQAQL